MSEGTDTNAYVGDLLTFATGPESQVVELRATRLASQAGGSGGAPGARFGLRRGTSATTWYDTGCRLEASDPAAAAAAYERALAGCPGFADAHNNLGRLRGAAGAPAVAESCYRLAICANPTVALYWFNLGVAVDEQGRQAEAIAAYERAIELDPATADAHYNLSRVLECIGKRTGDVALMRCAVRHLLRYRELARHTVSAR